MMKLSSQHVWIRWEEADFIKKTDDGSQGVLFVNIKGCGVVVLKSSMCLAGEVFSTIVAREMNIPGCCCSCPTKLLIFN